MVKLIFYEALNHSADVETYHSAAILKKLRQFFFFPFVNYETEL